MDRTTLSWLGRLYHRLRTNGWIPPVLPTVVWLMAEEIRIGQSLSSPEPMPTVTTRNDEVLIVAEDSAEALSVDSLTDVHTRSVVRLALDVSSMCITDRG